MKTKELIRQLVREIFQVTDEHLTEKTDKLQQLFDLLVYTEPQEVYCLKGCNVKPLLDKGPNVMVISRNNMTLCNLYDRI